MPEAADAELTLYYAPRSRAFTALWLLEELGVDYRLESFDLVSGRHKQPDYLALNPMGKVPLVVDHGVAVTERGAIAVYLCDRYPAAGLGPAVDDPQRAAWLRWLFFVGSVMEPAYTQHFFKWEVPPTTVAWGSFERMLEVVTAAMQPGPWLLGTHFSAADVLVASTLHFGIVFGIIPEEGPVADYVGRATSREAYLRADAIEEREAARFPPEQQS